jgi:hypothetical protein
LHGTFWLIRQGLTVLPESVKPLANVGETVASAPLGLQLARWNPLRQTIHTFLHAAGIEAGYGFFAPNVPDTYKLVFELHSADGRVEYEPAGVETGEAGLRFASLSDYLGRTSSDREREILLKLLVESVWPHHPHVVKVRAIVGSLALPDPAEFQHDKSLRYRFAYAYDFVRSDGQPKP